MANSFLKDIFYGKKKFFGITLSEMFFILSLWSVIALLIIFSRTSTKEACSYGRQIEALMNSFANRTDNSTFYLYREFPVKLEKKVTFCGYIFINPAENKFFIVYTDRSFRYIFIGNLIDIEKREVVGYKNLPTEEEWKSIRKEYSSKSGL